MSNVNLIEKAISDYPGDAYLYFGNVSREGYSKISSILENRDQKKNKACLILITYGGDPDAAYRIARALRHYYKEVEILIADLCKSAGTLICIGADRLIFGDRGELGPLDVQISKPDELFENMSGLDLAQALAALQDRILNSFRSYLLDISGNGGLRTKLAAELATKLAASFVSPIAAKIDPVTLGEHQRAMQIGYDYGLRLSEMTNSLKLFSLERLVGDYSSHGFVIDRKEASGIFNQVTKPDESTTGLYLWSRKFVEIHRYTNNSPIVIDLEKELANNKITNEKNEPNEKTNISPAERSNDGLSTNNSTDRESHKNESNNTRPKKSHAKPSS